MSLKSAVVEMIQNKHQVSIIGLGSCTLDSKAGVSRSFSSS